MSLKRNPKILIGLHEVAGYNGNLKKGFDELEIRSIFMELSDHPFKYGGSETNNVLIKLIRYFANKMSTQKEKALNKFFWLYCQQAAKFFLFLCVLFKYDVFIFGYKTSFLHFYDLPILKFFKKKIVYIFYGSDSRPPYINGYYLDLPIQEAIKAAYVQKKQIKRIERYADFIISHPASSHFHERKFIPCMRMGIPFLLDWHKNVASMLSDHKLRILHAPSDPKRKGTEIIRKIIKKMQLKGHSIELIEIIRKTNAEVLDELSRCDFIIDELYSDAAMAGFATEAAFFGKPAIVGGYANIYDWGELTDEMIPPVHHCHPDEIEEAVEKLIVDEAYRKELGEKAKQFVQKYWSAKYVAERYLRLIKGEIPEDWFYDPPNISYLHGWGLSEQDAKTFLRQVIKNGGLKALQLSDKPELEQKFVEFANS